jgi:hypothetical protein
VELLVPCGHEIADRIQSYIVNAGYGFRSSDLPLAAARHTDASLQSDGRGGSNLLRPGALLARAEADELLFNQARKEVVVVKCLD